MRACVFTLGCKVNEVESASIMQGLKERGFEVTDELSYAELYLINTCAVTAEAEKKSRQAIARVRKYNPNARVLVLGCAAEHSAKDFEEKGVSLVSGAMRKDKIFELLEKEGVFREAEDIFCELPAPARTKTRAFLRIQDGCNRFCSYCIIPYLRGRTRSRSAESVLKEAKGAGAKEIVLTGIDITSYQDGDIDLGGLLLLLKDIPARIRLGSVEPSLITREFLENMRVAGNAVPHFHLSLQSGSTKVLRAMNRHYTREEYLRKCALVYEYFPNAAITTDIIVGYPTETEADFLESLSIIEEAGLARVHAFPFSPREGTNAFKLKDLSAKVKRERMGRMLAAASRAEEKYIARFIGTERVALFEEEGGYTENYLRVYAEGAREGGMYRVRLAERMSGGVRAEIIEEI